MANTILLMGDEHNPRCSSVYGHPVVRTPNMERLARRGVVFENAYCASPLCIPSRSALMTGRRVHEIQAYSNCVVGPKADIPSYGRLLAERGVHTMYVGLSQAYDKAERLGFSSVVLPMDKPPPGDVNISRNPLRIRRGAARLADMFGPTEDPFKDDMERMRVALKWINSEARRMASPWLLCIDLEKPHVPMYVTQELWDAYLEGGDLSLYGMECETARHPYSRDLRAHFETEMFTETQMRGLRRGYLGCVTFVDAQLGRIMHALEAAGLTETTNLIYSADHGEMLGKFGLWWKCALYEDSVRVPLLAAGPDFARNERIATPVGHLDLHAALFRAFGMERPPKAHGIALQQMPKDDLQHVVFSEYHGHGTRSGAYMIRQGDWKLIYYMAAPHQLFNLRKDPDELDNRYKSEPRRAAQLEAELRKICVPEVENLKAHEFQENQLKSLGML